MYSFFSEILGQRCIHHVNPWNSSFWPSDSVSELPHFFLVVVSCQRSGDSENDWHGSSGPRLDDSRDCRPQQDYTVCESQFGSIVLVFFDQIAWHWPVRLIWKRQVNFPISELELKANLTPGRKAVRFGSKLLLLKNSHTRLFNKVLVLKTSSAFYLCTKELVICWKIKWMPMQLSPINF